LRGGKYSMYEGGTRIPFLARWSGRIQPGTSDAMLSQLDLFASFAKLTGQTLSPEAAPDSFEMLDVLLGKSDHGREYVVEHANGLSLRKGHWKLVPLGGKKDGNAVALYDLSNDVAETKNVAAENPEVAKELTELLEKIRADGRTRPAQ
jgi:arylsulfatase A-like enzyme